MTIEEIERTLPNGLHDAHLKKITIDYLSGVAKFDVQVYVGDPEIQYKEPEEAYRDGLLILSGLLFCIIEQPDPNYQYDKAESLWIADSGNVESIKLTTNLPKLLHNEAFIHYFFINDWNSFIYLAAKDARFDWI